MARFFNYFPKTIYSLSNTVTNFETVTNILTRFSFEKRLKENSSAFYKYTIQDGDTPEIIARKYYDNSERHWIVLLFNDIVDAQYDWPLTERNLMIYIDSKYSANGASNATPTSGMSWAKSPNNPYAYYKVITKTTRDAVSVERYEVDANTYANDTIMQTGTDDVFTLNDGTSVNIEITKEVKTHYDYEVELNQNKREIKLLKKEFVTELENEFKRVVRL